MHVYRKLLVLGLNELLGRKLLSLNPAEPVEGGHLLTSLAGERSVIIWHGISGDEVSLSVWWKYDHSKHPQANLEGSQKESFHGPAPLAKPQHYQKFVGAFTSGWVERRSRQFLQGVGSKGLCESYTRRSDLQALQDLAIPTPAGFEPEGKFFM